VRYSFVYESSKHQLEVKLITPNQVIFILEYKASGCPNFSVRNASVTRNDTNAVVTCTHKNIHYNLQCYNTEWIGETNFYCLEKEKKNDGFKHLSPEFLAALIVSVIFLFCSCLFVIILWCLNRKYLKRRSSDRSQNQYQMAHISCNSNFSHQSCKENYYDPRNPQKPIDNNEMNSLVPWITEDE